MWNYIIRMSIVVASVLAFVGPTPAYAGTGPHHADDRDMQPQPDTAEQIRQQLQDQQREQIAEMWERGEFMKDAGGLIPLVVLRQAPEIARGEIFQGPLPPDVLRRNTFDAWCDRLAIVDAVSSERLDEIWRQYARNINQVLLQWYPRVYELSSRVRDSSEPMSHADTLAFEDMLSVRQRAVREVQHTEDQLFRILGTIDQGHLASAVESWHFYRRWQRSSLSSVEISGARLHLTDLFESLDLEWPSIHIRRAYEMEIAGAAERYDAQRIQSAARLAELRASGFYNHLDERYEFGSPESAQALAEYRRRATPLRRQRWQRQRELYNINTRYITLLSILLDDHDAERVYDEFAYRAFSDYFPNRYDLRRWFDQLLDDEPIGAALRPEVEELRQTYVAVQRSADDSLIRTIHDHERDFVLTRSRDPKRRALHQRELDYELQRRHENAVIFAVRLVELLDDDERFGWVKDDLEELLATELTRTW